MASTNGRPGLCLVCARVSMRVCEYACARASACVYLCVFAHVSARVRCALLHARDRQDVCCMSASVRRRAPLEAAKQIHHFGREVVHRLLLTTLSMGSIQDLLAFYMEIQVKMHPMYVSTEHPDKQRILFRTPDFVCMRAHCPPGS